MSNESNTPVLPVLSELYPLSNKWWTEVEKITPSDAVLASMGIDPETFAESCSLDRGTSEDAALGEAFASYRPSLGAEQKKFEQRHNELIAAINACEIACDDQSKSVENSTYTITKIRKDDFVAWVLDPLIAWDLPAFIKQSPSSHPKDPRDAIARWALKELIMEGVFNKFGNYSKTTEQIHKKMKLRGDYASIECETKTLRNFLFYKPDSIWFNKTAYMKHVESLKKRWEPGSAPETKFFGLYPHRYASS